VPLEAVANAAAVAMGIALAPLSTPAALRDLRDRTSDPAWRDIYAEYNPPRSYSGHGISDCSPSIGKLVLKGAERGEGGIWNPLVEAVG
jgi:hypothetical protein